MPKILKNCILFFRRETVLCIAALLALLSVFFVPPSAVYISYIDWDTLCPFVQSDGGDERVSKGRTVCFPGKSTVKKNWDHTKMLLVLVFLPFVFSMVITNDVSLITFVPFGIIVLRMAKQEHLVTPLVVMQTVAANLGSMLTPMGNPQNLYLYAKSGMGFGELCWLLAPMS